MEKLKEELETMNDLMEQKDTLTQKLEVKHSFVSRLPVVAQVGPGQFSVFVALMAPFHLKIHSSIWAWLLHSI